MLSHKDVSIVLLVIWGIAFIVLNKRLVTSKVYFVLLFLMGLAGLILPLDHWLDIGTNNDFNIFIIVLFAFLMLGSIIPWLKFDHYFSKVKAIYFKPEFENSISVLMLALIILGVYAILYTLPYAVIGYRMGGADVRDSIRYDSPLPSSPLTTIAVGVGFLAPIYILLFFFSFTSTRFRRFTIPLFLTSLSYLVSSAPFQARDGFIMIPLTYYFLYQVFKGYLPEQSLKTIKKIGKTTIPILIAFLLIITIDRFYVKEGNPWEQLISGTWGYLYQQPYVFDQTIQHQSIFYGIGNRFPLLGYFFGIESTGKLMDFQFEWMFGSMYASFYSATGWSSLILASLFFFFSWTIVFQMMSTRQNFLGMLVVFSIYLFFLVSGLFYLRLCAISITITYLVIIFLAFFLKKYAVVELK